MSDLPDPTDYKNQSAVQDAREAVRQEEKAIKEMKADLQEAREKVQEFKQDLAELKADARVGDATEADVDETREKLISTEEEAQRLQAEIQTSERAVEKLEGKLRQKEGAAKAEIENQLRQEYHTRLKTAIKRLEDAEEAVQAAGEIGSKLRSEHMRSVASMNDHPQRLVEGVLDSSSMEVAVLTHVGNVRYTSDELKQKAAKAGVTT